MHPKQRIWLVLGEEKWNVSLQTTQVSTASAVLPPHLGRFRGLCFMPIQRLGGGKTFHRRWANRYQVWALHCFCFPNINIRGGGVLLLVFKEKYSFLSLNPLLTSGKHSKAWVGRWKKVRLQNTWVMSSETLTLRLVSFWELSPGILSHVGQIHTMHCEAALVTSSDPQTTKAWLVFGSPSSPGSLLQVLMLLFG